MKDLSDKTIDTIHLFFDGQFNSKMQNTIYFDLLLKIIFRLKKSVK